jgi:hypothetical protein
MSVPIRPLWYRFGCVRELIGTRPFFYTMYSSVPMVQQGVYYSYMDCTARESLRTKILGSVSPLTNQMPSFYGHKHSLKS